MKHQIIRITGIFGFLLLAVAATAGTWSANKFFYQPALDARGSTEKNNFDTGLNRVDTHLANEKTLGDPNYSTLAEALDHHWQQQGYPDNPRGDGCHYQQYYHWQQYCSEDSQRRDV